MRRPDTARDQPVRSDDLVDEASTARATIDERGIVTGWSEGARRLLGHPDTAVVGRPASRLLADGAAGDLPGLPERLTRWSGELTLRHRDGRPLRVGLLARRRATADGGAEWLLVSPLDRTAPAAADDELIRASFFQGPCTMAVFDTRLLLRWANADLEGTLDLGQDEMRGLRISEIVADTRGAEIERLARQVLETGLPQYLSLPPSHGKAAWSSSLAPLRGDDGRVLGVILSGHDVTVQYETQRRLARLNEASVRIGSTLDIVRTAQELTDVAAPEFADFAVVDLLPSIHPGGDEPPPGPVPGTLVLRRVAAQSALEGKPDTVIALGELAVYPEHSPAAECLAAGRGVLTKVTPETIARWEQGDPARAARLREFGFHSTIAVPLRARGTTLGVAAFARHRRPEPFEEDDLLLAEEITARAAVCIDNAHRYTRQRAAALALQRSLLPRTLPRHAAVETACRYLPAGSRAGVGGDWFDVIPLSGARVALVVGDVVGHGFQASAAMGRLRTAVRTLADVELPPDELLTHLDDLVNRLSAETEGEPGADAARAAGDVGATCLYAVYDPVSRRCTLARAGHPPPLLTRPDGTAEYLDLPSGPPLGLGSLPFESREVELEEGSLLSLYTNGLIQAPDRDVDEAVDTLRTVLSRPAGSLDDLCGTVLSTLVPGGRPADDVALLVARTRALDASQVATWDLPADPAVVARARKHATGQLLAWGLDEAVFTTELVVSELVTNAIRHAQGPIQLRLIHDRALICEVSDGSNTAPHLRRARVFDEGGRGLLLVAQLARSWGTRHGPAGKTIWAEQSLPGPAG
ncbi:SpoIIE family protein phosphatase [Streptomyces sp. ME19-01-6]|uniref:ATP-binding SpoIIE family protein phosphatase n=1 Tax=Streptomyces sp. ME19-01-6 TaxID=3028686 RepID=UPI0029A4FF91|nr:SpoIIE family protein phosphatase [Streptomyces sp. ME19-01-6]MDX3232730.1 SpoIIE family protein phosphatase [Streptomyces sp. ME19-01-6]